MDQLLLTESSLLVTLKFGSCPCRPAPICTHVLLSPACCLQRQLRLVRGRDLHRRIERLQQLGHQDLHVLQPIQCSRSMVVDCNLRPHPSNLVFRRTALRLPHPFFDGCWIPYLQETDQEVRLNLICSQVCDELGINKKTLQSYTCTINYCL